MLNLFRRRLTPEEIERVLTLAVTEGRITRDGGAVMFHDFTLLREHVDALSVAFPNAFHAIAIKANPVVGVLRRVVQAGAGLEAASIEEVHLARAAGCPPGRIVYDSPAKSVSNLAEALALGVRINADNEDELARLDRILVEQGTPTAPVGLRINPGVGEGNIAITSVAGQGARFGMAADAASLLRVFAARPWLTGIHIHVGSQGCPLSLLVAAVQQAFDLVTNLNARMGRPQIRTLDIGGGLPALYKTGTPVPSLSEYAAGLREAVPGIFDGSLEIVTEFGRSVQAGCGFTASPVEYVKEVAGSHVAVIHAGADLFLRSAYHPLDWPHEFSVFDGAGRLRGGPTKAWTIAGPLCFAGDVIGRGVALPDLHPGDLLVVRDTGAYTLGMWSHHCSRGMPLVLGYEEREGRGFEVLRRHQSPDDLVAFWQLGEGT